jgi:hypothetical protein
MSLTASKILFCAASLLVSAFFLWQGDKAISFHICAFRSMRTKQDLDDLLSTSHNPALVLSKIIPALIALVGVGIMTIVDRSVAGLIVFAVGVVAFCISSALDAYGAMKASKRNGVSP